MNKILFLLIAVLFVQKFLLPIALAPETIKNSLPEIQSKMGKISLELIYTWGDGDEEGHIFKTPSDIAIDSENHVYIVDSALHCIKVFDSNRQFIREISRRGQGPGDTLTPINIGINSNNTIWVFEAGNRRIQAFSGKGISQTTVNLKQRMMSNIVFPSKNQIAVYDDLSAKKGEGLITIIEPNSRINRKIGQHILLPQVNLPFRGGQYDSCNISFNLETEQYYITYTYSQMIQQFKKTGEPGICIFYDTPLNKLELSWEPRRRNYDLIKKKKDYSECIDSDINADGLLFIVASTRLPKENEGKSMLFYPDGIIEYQPHSKEYPTKTDIYRLMVFGKNGKILAAKQLDVFCDGIYIHNDHIFLIDKTFAQVIYEFKYKIIP